MENLGQQGEDVHDPILDHAGIFYLLPDDCQTGEVPLPVIAFLAFHAVVDRITNHLKRTFGVAPLDLGPDLKARFLCCEAGYDLGVDIRPAQFGRGCVPNGSSLSGFQ